ncbi:hypothetical protein L195_g050241 [Trifolium pratense]|uniref:Uncharacterized protein n=1 Tax=Trifolium pratense TaxID=57577 RepID=A0A2K3JSW3_TRIPR|nr:hypothetical protein L195_g050241 [Trifolium pratense]
MTTNETTKHLNRESKPFRANNLEARNLDKKEPLELSKSEAEPQMKIRTTQTGLDGGADMRADRSTEIQSYIVIVPIWILGEEGGGEWRCGGVRDRKKERVVNDDSGVLLK